MLNAAHYGVPQLRERVFLIGSRDGTRFQFPYATHGPVSQDDMFAGKQPYMTTWDAIGDLPEQINEPSLTVGGRWGDLLSTISEGKNYLWHTSREGGLNLFGWRTRYWSFLLKLAKNHPSWTIQAQPGSAIGPFHWTSRKLTNREMCRIQTFPDDLVFSCGRTEVQRMLGNAVPSLLAEVLAREIRQQLLGSPNEQSLRLMPSRRRPIPAPEPLLPVPDIYLPMIGDHAEHPGTGKSAKALARAAKSAAPQLLAAAE